tara:strand:- start:120 stop:323 length:204 start_codon:yes stop_codon:yes gene_type:complete
LERKLAQCFFYFLVVFEFSLSAFDNVGHSPRRLEHRALAVRGEGEGVNACTRFSATASTTPLGPRRL